MHTLNLYNRVVKVARSGNRNSAAESNTPSHLGQREETVSH